jgi:hypothetical protein
LSTFVFIGEDLPSISACIGLTFMFAKMYSKQSINILVTKLLKTIKRLLLLNGFYLIAYNIVRFSFAYLPDYYQTKH